MGFYFTFSSFKHKKLMKTTWKECLITFLKGFQAAIVASENVSKHSSPSSVSCTVYCNSLGLEEEVVEGVQVDIASC